MPRRRVLVLAGGRGERFWPWSTSARPKQLLPLAQGGRTLLAATVERAQTVVAPRDVVILTARDLIEPVRHEAGGACVAGEPMMRNTAPAIGAVAEWLLAEGGDPAFAVMPADHAIDDREAFRAALERAFVIAERDPVLVTFGIPPRGPETNFGYIQAGDRLAADLFRVARFTEKPDLARAAAWIAGGGYYWNSGIFVWRASVFLAALAASRPALADALRPMRRAGDVAEFESALAEVFPTVESISVDYAVLESAPNTVMIPAAFDWDDLGSWSSWARRQEKDERGNVRFGDAIAIDCDRCIVVGEGGVAAALKLSDMVVVHAGGATLTCPIEDSERVREVSVASRERAR